eukprot:3944107-Pyramimonas_sp.AAC.1
MSSWADAARSIDEPIGLADAPVPAQVADPAAHVLCRPDAAGGAALMLQVSDGGGLADRDSDAIARVKRMRVRVPTEVASSSIGEN